MSVFKFCPYKVEVEYLNTLLVWFSKTGYEVGDGDVSIPFVCTLRLHKLVQHPVYQARKTVILYNCI